MNYEIALDSSHHGELFFYLWENSLLKKREVLTLENNPLTSSLASFIANNIIDNLSKVYIALGPGSLTQIRVALAFIKGLKTKKPFSCLGFHSALPLIPANKTGKIAIILQESNEEFLISSFEKSINENPKFINNQYIKKTDLLKQKYDHLLSKKNTIYCEIKTQKVNLSLLRDTYHNNHQSLEVIYTKPPA